MIELVRYRERSVSSSPLVRLLFFFGFNASDAQGATFDLDAVCNPASSAMEAYRMRDRDRDALPP
jgi:hypothetical protein